MTIKFQEAHRPQIRQHLKFAMMEERGLQYILKDQPTDIAAAYRDWLTLYSPEYRREIREAAKLVPH